MSVRLSSLFDYSFFGGSPDLVRFLEKAASAVACQALAQAARCKGEKVGFFIYSAKGECMGPSSVIKGTV